MLENVKTALIASLRWDEGEEGKNCTKRGIGLTTMVMWTGMILKVPGVENKAMP